MIKTISTSGATYMSDPSVFFEIVEDQFLKAAEYATWSNGHRTLYKGALLSYNFICSSEMIAAVARKGYAYMHEDGSLRITQTGIDFYTLMKL